MVSIFAVALQEHSLITQVISDGPKWTKNLAGLIAQFAGFLAGMLMLLGAIRQSWVIVLFAIFFQTLQGGLCAYVVSLLVMSKGACNTNINAPITWFFEPVAVSIVVQCDSAYWLAHL